MKKVKALRANVGILVLISLFASPFAVFGQTRVVAPKNPYNESKDVELGRQAAQQAERQLPLLKDRDVQYYVERVGNRLAEAIPPEFQHPQFHYTFKVVDVRDLNAFALPGGFTFVNRGLIEAAHNEGEMAGVIAHEISHVALRHGTAQVAKAQKYQAGAAVIGILGSIFGGPAVGQLGQMGVGAYFLKFSREYERDADILGSQIMARAGYDPHDLANIFRTLERQGGSGAPQWLSDHPNPGNRFEYINREADALRVANPIKTTEEFTHVQALLRDLPRARSMQEIGRTRQRYPDQGDQRYPQQGNQRSPQQDDPRYPQQDDPRSPQQDDPRYPQQDNQRYPRQTDQRNSQQRGREGQVDYPSSRFRAYSGNYFRISVPDNWRELPAGDNVTFAPEGGYSNTQGQIVYTHGVQVGSIHGESGSLRTATERLISELTQSNQGLRKNGGYERELLGKHEGLSISLGNVSAITGRPEIVTVYTTMLRNGDLFYVIAVAPQDEYQNYQRTFLGILRTVELSD
jgi:beta-barrel assembly-enhancing protease